MSYKFTTGSVRRGDVFYEDDREGQPTYIDFGQDAITLRPSGSQILHALPEVVGINTTSPAALLTLNDTEPKILFTENNSSRAQIWINDSDNLKFRNNVSNQHIVFEINDSNVIREGLRIRGNSSPSNNPEVVVNEGSDSLVDFRVESNNQTHMLFIDGASDKVGINTDAPDYTLDVAGDIGVDEYIYHNGDADTLIRFNDDKIVLKAGNKAMVTVEEKASAPHEVTINDGSNNIDFVVKGNGSRGGNPGMKFDASTNKVGINGVGTPEESLHVDGNIKVFGDDVRIKIDGDTNSHPGIELYENGTRKWIAYNDYTNDNLTFKTDSNVRMSISQDGKVGINTTQPETALDISSDSIRLRSSNTPSSASDFGHQGEIRWDANYIYICVATDTWKRVALSSW